MGLLDILQQVVSASGGLSAANPDQHFDQVAQQAPSGVFQQGVADAMRSDQTPPFGEMIGQMFGQARPQQQADLLNQILQSLGPGALSAIGGGALGSVLGSLTGGGAAGGAVPTITPQQASQLSPQQVSEIAAQAHQQNPGIIDAISGFYSQHPALVKTLGSAVLAIAMAKMHERMQQS